jgi:hypothetical protein
MAGFEVSTEGGREYLMGRYQVSEPRAKLAARFCRSSLRYPPSADRAELAQTRVRFGYLRLLVLLRCAAKAGTSGRSVSTCSGPRRARHIACTLYLSRLLLMNSYVERTRLALSFVDIGIALRDFRDAS